MIRIHGQGDCQIIPFPEDRKAIDIGDYYADYDKICQAVDWKPTTSLQDGLTKTLDYYYHHIKHYL